MNHKFITVLFIWSVLSSFYLGQILLALGLKICPLRPMRKSDVAYSTKFFLSLGDWGYDRRDWSTGRAGEWVLETYKKVKITCVNSFVAEQQLQWKNNLKLNTLSLIMSIGAVQSHKEWLGKEYGGLLFNFSNSGDLWGTKRNGRSVFRN